MIVDGRSLPAGERIAADLCIVGAGAAGLTLAGALDGPGRRIVLAESGGMDAEASTQGLYEGETSGIPYALSLSRLRFFGGSTNHWAGACRRLDAQDFSARPWMPGSGWPFAGSALDAFGERARTICDLQPRELQLAALGAAGKALVPWRGPMETALWEISPPTRFGEKFGPALARSPNVTVLLHANLTGLSCSGERIVSAEFRTLEGSAFRVDAARYVLACGGIENARLLLASQSDRFPAGLGNTHDLVGRFFMEHPEFPIGILAYNLPPGHAIGHWFKVENRQVAEGFRLASRVQEEMGIGNAGFFPLSNFRSDAADVSDIPGAPSIQDTAARLSRRMPGSREATKLRLVIEQAPDRENRVTLSERRDALGQKRTHLHWRLSEFDRRTATAAVRLLALECGRQNIGRLWLDEPFRDLASPDWPAPASGPIAPDPHHLSAEIAWGCHHMGTTRMHADPRQGVVDPDCKVHGLSNLYVAGSSVFPAAGISNPTLTIVALALRLAAHLAS